MKKTSENKHREDDLLPEYEFDYAKARRGKYCHRLIEEGANVIVLEPDIAKAFKDSAAVNNTLRALLDLARTARDTPARNAR